ncbi:MAB_1171c family putative transporter [Kitasatospora sp. NPDC088134]|uniref:MAB_1171c family putative transporter n=1 Tax=Kitasatospora sp. NPDC088134 TaxID=3364071 RepID=UPI0038181C72
MGDGVVSALCWSAASVALLGTLWKVLLDCGRRSDRALRYGYACGGLIGAGMVSSAPGTAAALSAVLPDPAQLTLLADQLKTVAAGALAMMALSTRPPGAARRALRRQAALTTTAVLLGIAVFTAAGPVRAGSALGVGSADRPVLALYVALFALHAAWCLTVFGVLIGRCARCLPPGTLRLGLRLMTLGALAGLLWTADNLRDLAEVLGAGRENGAESGVSAVAAAVCVTLGLAGATAAAWADWGGRLRARRDHRRLGPLWSALRTALPEIELLAPEGRFEDRRRRRGRPGQQGGDARFALYRRIIEIRDGQLALRPHLHPAVALWVGEAVGRPDAVRSLGPLCAPGLLRSAGSVGLVRAVGAEHLAATVEAAAIAAALEAATAGHRFAAGPGARCGPHPVAAGVPEEAAWLVKVAAAYAGSPAVAHVRRRVRQELGPPAPPPAPPVSGPPGPAPGQAPTPGPGQAPNPRPGQAPNPRPGQAPNPRPGQAPASSGISA